jgi:acyl dehydratase
VSLPHDEGRDLASVQPDQILYAEDLAVGDWMDLGPVEVTRDEIVRFAKQFDPLPIHVDGTESPFGDVIASGMHTLSLFASMSSPKFMARLALVAGKGFDRMRLPNPVRPGSVLTGSLQVVEVRMGSRKADVHCIYELVDQNGDLVMTMLGIQVVRRRHPVAD